MNLANSYIKSSSISSNNDNFPTNEDIKTNIDIPTNVPNENNCKKRNRIICIIAIVIGIIIIILLAIILPIKLIKKSDKNNIFENKDIYDIDFQKNSFEYITDLINISGEGSVINLYGYYSGNGSSINIKKKITIIGNNDTILDAKGSSSIFKISSSNVSIINMKLINGISFSGNDRYLTSDDSSLINRKLENINHYPNLGYGGGIFWTGSYGQIINCTFENNHASNSGGAIYVNGYDIRIINTLFINNSVIGNYNELEGGGAIFGEGEKNVIKNCIFINNSAIKGVGGAIKWENYLLSLNYNIFKNNSAFYGNYIFANNFESFNNNEFYFNSISDINSSIKGANILSLFDNNHFIVNDKIISKNAFFPNNTFDYIRYLVNNADYGGYINLEGYYYGDGIPININKMITIIGKDNTILDSNFSSFIFNISSINVTINNLKIINGISTIGGAIYWTGNNGILSNCKIGNNKGYNYGGGIFFSGSYGQIINCTFENNHASNYGGAIYINGYDIRIINSLFINNSVIGNYNESEGGGAIFGEGEQQFIENCIFINNSAIQGVGGAIKWGNYLLSLNYNIFKNNSALYGNNIFANNFELFNNNEFYFNSISDINSSIKGSDILSLFDNNNFIVNGKIISKNAFFPNNTFDYIRYLVNNADYGVNISLEGYYYGDGIPININKMITIIGKDNTILDSNFSSFIFNISSVNVTVNNLKFINSISTFGGAIYWTGNNGILSNCKIENNKGYKYGGGIFWSGSYGKIINCTFENNYASNSGGAIYVNGYDIRINNSLFVNNSVIGNYNESEGGGAIFGEGENLFIEDCIFTNNSASENSGGALQLSDDSFSVINNIFKNNSALNGNNFFSSNFEAFAGNKFYFNSISEIDYSAKDGDILSLFDNNYFIVNDKIISKNDFFPTNTFEYINYLINQVEYGGTIKLSGHYIGNCSHIDVKKIITIIGENNTVLDGNGCSRVFEVYSMNVIIDNIKIVNGTEGTVFWSGVMGILSNCVLENNKGSRYGGAVIWNGSNGKIINCTFENNLGNNFGGAVCVGGEGIKIVNSLFINNSVLGTLSLGEGGGAINGGINGIIENCTFINNTALKSRGGALKLGNYLFSVRNNIFRNNSALLGNNIFANNFELFNGNIFYMNSISDINSSAQDDNILKLFDNNTFIVDGNIIVKDYFYQKKSFSEIINLISNTKDGDIIHLNGYYIGDGTSIIINKKITIIGDDNTILDSNGHSKIFEISSNNVVINNLILLNSHDYYDGGGLFWSGNNGILSNCIIKNNSGGRYGGGVLWWASNGTIINCTFENNYINQYGGAAYINGNNNKIINSLFKNNSVLGKYNQWEGGGAIYIDGDNQVVQNCTFINNTAPESWGGAIKLGSGSFSVINNIFRNNSALLGNHIFSGNFDIFNGNIFYINSIYDINSSAQDDNILKLFDNNTFIVDKSVISKDVFSSKFKPNKFIQ